MRILMLGGTGFAGFHTSSFALQRGDDVLLFNRGKTRPDELAGAERIVGDRFAGDVKSLGEIGEVDAVIDFTGYTPTDIDVIAKQIAGKVKRYVFISSISAYAWPFPPNAPEDAPLAELPEGADHSKVTMETYGAQKALSEAAVRAAYGESATIVRPGLIVGPLDPTDRFTYWVRRGTEGGRILAPGDPSTPVQVIDGRDLANFLLRIVDSDASGIFNAVGEQHTFEQMLQTTCADGELVWISNEDLEQHDLPQGSLPLWVPGEGGDTLGTVNKERAEAAGLELRPLSETVADTRAWDIERGQPDLKVGLDRARQDELVA